jgi:hypothetical protein
MRRARDELDSAGLSSRDFLYEPYSRAWAGPGAAYVAGAARSLQEAMPIRSRYQGGAYSPVQHHEVVAGQGRAVAGERGGMRAAVVAPGPLPMTRTS